MLPTLLRALSRAAAAAEGCMLQAGAAAEAEAAAAPAADEAFPWG